MDPGKDEPIDREPWRRLLAADAGAPLPGTDRKILAQARRALTPRTGRWWLPASLAASLFLAVLIGRWQLEDSSTPPLVTESDVLPAQAPASGAMPEPREMPAAAAARPAQAAPPPPAAAEREPPVAAESRADATAAAPAPARAMREFGALRADQEAATTARPPEEWYAEIESLRAAGHIEQAQAELARLEAAWPGWLASHTKQKQ